MVFELTDQALARVQPLLPANSRRGKPWRDHRQVLGGIVWKLHTGRPWRDVPERFGPWQTCSGRLRRWQRDGTWLRLWAVLAAGEHDLKRLASSGDMIGPVLAGWQHETNRLPPQRPGPA
jgi:transposase